MATEDASRPFARPTLVYSNRRKGSGGNEQKRRADATSRSFEPKPKAKAELEAQELQGLCSGKASAKPCSTTQRHHATHPERCTARCLSCMCCLECGATFVNAIDNAAKLLGIFLAWLHPVPRSQRCPAKAFNSRKARDRAL